MHSNDVMTENTLNFLNKPNELSGKMAVDMKDDFSCSLWSNAIDKAGKSLGYKNFSGKSSLKL